MGTLLCRPPLPSLSLEQEHGIKQGERVAQIHPGKGCCPVSASSSGISKRACAGDRDSCSPHVRALMREMPGGSCAFGAGGMRDSRVLHPLRCTHGEENGETPIYHQHMRELVRITINCSSQGRQAFHTGTTSPCLIRVTPGRSRTTSRNLPARRS